jgi:CPA2 family monovalent cation:H+ antiporter-2
MHEVGLILTITVGLAVALVLGVITHRLGLSPIVGYLLAGLAVGPYTPGFVADQSLAAQLAEIGVILLMFGVGLHFHWKDLMAVRAVALPGAIGQSAVATGLGVLMTWQLGWSLGAGLVLGIALSVASTVVLIRVLMDNDALNTPSGHTAVGWLVAEDIFTVLVLVLLPAVTAVAQSGEGFGARTGYVLLIALGKLALLGALMALVGVRLIPWLLERVARTRSRELFTLTVLVLALGIAAGSAFVFGASMALGAFLAGMVVGQSQVSHQAASDALPMRDAFAVLFFVSVGMLFDPGSLMEHPGLLAATLAIILVGKPLAALLIVVLLGRPVRTALTVAVGLAQIGEFSFILSELGRSLKVLPEAGHNVLVAGALISITLNPLLFRQVGRVERWLQRRPKLWRLLTWRSQGREGGALASQSVEPDNGRAVVVGYGPVGKTLTRILQDFGIQPVIIEMNIETVKKLRASGMQAIFGDASRRDILEAAGVTNARFLLVTLPDVAGRVSVVATARLLHPGVRVLTRARYLGERALLEESGADAVAYEECEVAVALAAFLLKEIGLDEEAIAREAGRVRSEIAVRSEKTVAHP